MEGSAAGSADISCTFSSKGAALQVVLVVVCFIACRFGFNGFIGMWLKQLLRCSKGSPTIIQYTECGLH